MQVCLSRYDLLLKELNIYETKIAKLKFVNWTSKNEKNVEIFRMSRFLLHLHIHLWNFFYFGIKSHKIEHTFKTPDLSKSTKQNYI